MDTTDKDILNFIQREFPLVREPFEAIGREVGLAGDEVIRRIEALKRGRVIRQISAIFDTRVLGYHSSLVAARIPKDKLTEGAKAINSHPGVSHNYERNNYFNLWYTVAVPPDSRLGLGEHRGCHASHKWFGEDPHTPDIEAFQDRGDARHERGSYGEEDVAPQYGENDRLSADRNVSEDDKVGHSGSARGYSADPEAVRPLGRASRAHPMMSFSTGPSILQERKIMRRFSAVLYHRKAGFRANAMGVWNVPEERVEEVGNAFAQYQAVSHCYQRPTYEDWPYSIFSMVHGRSVEECENLLDAMAEETGITERESLYSTREYKKTRVRYFTPGDGGLGATLRRNAPLASLAGRTRNL